MNKKPIKFKMPKKWFLEGVRGRLENEVGLYLAYVKQRKINFENPAVGFWAGVRLLFPVVESLADVLLKRSEFDKREKPIRFLGQYLGVKYPSLIWLMYRNSLLHTDSPGYLVYKKKFFPWAISLGREDHQAFSPDSVGLDIEVLYNKLKAFLDDEVIKSQGSVFIEIGTKITKLNKNDHRDSGILKEMESKN